MIEKNRLRPLLLGLLISGQCMAAPYIERPVAHFTPPQAWMNDPNGMYYHQGEYHLFYQHYPDALVWGPMHWGHAISTDLMNWQDMPIALYPDEHGMIFSGSAVVDVNNTSGLGSLENPPVVALFTYHDEAMKQQGSKVFETQGMAYSLDNGRTWQKHHSNPVIANPGKVDFRDPKVSWHAPSKRWVMVVTQGKNLGFYTSKDLIGWQHVSDFGDGLGAHGGVWECPDLIVLKDPDSGQDKYVLIVSLVPGGPNGGSATQYFVGDFDGETFSADEWHQQHPQQAKWLDYGPDNYAGVTFSGLTGEAPLFMGWASNWAYATSVPATDWRSALTLPRRLALIQSDQGLRVTSQLSEHVQKAFVPQNIVLEASQLPLRKTTAAHKISFNLDVTDTALVVLKNQQEEQVTLLLDRTNQVVKLSRGQLSAHTFNANFIPQVSAAHVFKKSTDVTLVLDNNLLEVFIDGGQTNLTSLLFPDSAFDSLVLPGDAEKIEYATYE